MDNTYRVDVSFSKLYATDCECKNATDYLSHLILLGLTNNKGAGNKKTTETNFIGNACANYNPQVPYTHLLLAAEQQKCKTFMSLFGIKDRVDIYCVLKLIDDSKIDDLKPDTLNLCSQKAYTYKDNDPTWKYVKKYIASQKFSDRGNIVKNIAFQYFVMTKDEYFFEQAAKNMFMYMLQLDRENKESELDKLVDTIWMLSKTIDLY